MAPKNSTPAVHKREFRRRKHIYILYIAIVQHLPDVSRQEAPGVRFPGLAISRTRSTTKMDRKM